jgi:hypothetical protein
MNIAVATKSALLELCTSCGVGMTDDSWCQWCHFWMQLSMEPVREQEWVMGSPWSAKRFANLCGIEVA